jgi:hypothetical protein
MKTAAISVLFICFSYVAHAQTVALYGASTGAGSLYQISSTNGTGTLVGALRDAGNNAFGIQALAADSTGQLWGATSTNSPTSPNSLVRVNAGTAVVTVVGPLNAPSGGTAAGIGCLTNGTLVGWFSGNKVYGTVNTSTGQVTAVTAPQATTIGGLAVAPTTVIAVPNIFPAGSVFSITSAFTSPTAHLNLFDPIGNTETNIQNLANAPGAYTALTISSAGTLFALAGGSLVSISVLGTPNTLGAAPAGVVSLAFAPVPAVTISVTPPSATLGPGQGQLFNAIVGNTANTAVTWSIPGGAPGTINANGAYIAPATIATQQTVTITATSQADNTKTATATVTLVTFVSPVPVPPTVWLAALGLLMAAVAARYFRTARA